MCFDIIEKTFAYKNVSQIHAFKRIFPFKVIVKGSLSSGKN